MLAIDRTVVTLSLPSFRKSPRARKTTSGRKVVPLAPSEPSATLSINMQSSDAGPWKTLECEVVQRNVMIRKPTRQAPVGVLVTTKAGVTFVQIVEEGSIAQLSGLEVSTPHL